MVERFVPAITWLKTYTKDDLKSDVIAGTIVAIMLVPQGMAYAMLAGLPPVFGLYASTIPLIIYALFGSSRHLCIGPVAMVSLLVFMSCSKLAPPGSNEYIALTIMLSLMIGILQMLMGIFRMGFFVNFFSHAVITGFSSAAALIICSSQLKHLLGITLKADHSFLFLIIEILRHWRMINISALFIGISSIVLLLFFKKRFPHFPAPLFIVVLSICFVYFFNLSRFGIQVVGIVPQGLPRFSRLHIEIKKIKSLLPTALTILFVGYMESIAVAKLIAAKSKYKVDADQELIALGLANTIGAFFSCYPVTGGFSRTAVNYQSGARTGMSSIFTAFIIIMTLLFFTPLFYYLPNTVLASIIIAAVLQFIDIKEIKHLFTIKKADGWTAIITLILTLFWGVEEGIAIGILFSLFIFIWRSAHPHSSELGYVENEGVFHDIKRFPEAKTFPHVLILRVDASFYFANMSFFEEILHSSIRVKQKLERVIIDFSGVNDIDGVAITSLEGIMDTYQDQGISFHLASIKGPVRDLIVRAGWREKYGKGISYSSIKHALEDSGVDV